MFDCEALFMLRWLGRAPEDFLTGPVGEVGEVRLPDAGDDSRLRWDLRPPADTALVRRVTQWLGQPAAAFIHPAQW